MGYKKRVTTQVKKQGMDSHLSIFQAYTVINCLFLMP
jgi:hypothetical protein